MAHLDRSGTYLDLSDADIADLYVRVGSEDLQQELASVTCSPIVDGLMQSVSGLFAVLNDSRQIVAVNDTFLSRVGANDTLDLLGLRPGEAVHCVHANDSPGGCGTGKLCVSCGAAIAIVTSLSQQTSVERKCVATIWRNGGTEDICFNVRSTPYPIAGKLYLMLILQDISEQEKWAEIQRVFFHDIRNIAFGLVGASRLLEESSQANDVRLTKVVCRLSHRLENELKIQQGMVQMEVGDLQPDLQPVSIGEVLNCLKDIYQSHPIAISKKLTLPASIDGDLILTDLPLLLRVMSNMITNAFEASQNGGEVRLWLEQDVTSTTFCVWNSEVIPEQISGRIFQRFFSTKSEHGRGTGTYMMKFFGEKALKGKVGFTSTVPDGTIFRFTVPRG